MWFQQVEQPSRTGAFLAHNVPRTPWMNSRMVVALVSMTESITTLPCDSITATETHGYRAGCLLDVHANILLAVDKGAPFRGLSSTPKAYLKKGAPFYNALKLRHIVSACRS